MALHANTVAVDIKKKKGGRKWTVHVCSEYHYFEATYHVQCVR